MALDECFWDSWSVIVVALYKLLHCWALSEFSLARVHSSSYRSSFWALLGRPVIFRVIFSLDQICLIWVGMFRSLSSGIRCIAHRGFWCSLGTYWSSQPLITFDLCVFSSGASWWHFSGFWQKGTRKDFLWGHKHLQLANWHHIYLSGTSLTVGTRGSVVINEPENTSVRCTYFWAGFAAVGDLDGINMCGIGYLFTAFVDCLREAVLSTNF